LHINYIYAKNEINFYIKGENEMTEKFVDPIDELLARHMNQEELEERAAKHAQGQVWRGFVEGGDRAVFAGSGAERVCAHRRQALSDTAHR
jgi:hypothetical protein